MYNIDYIKLILWLVPEELSKVKTLNYLNCLITPIKQLYYLFLDSRRFDLYRLNHNGQVCYLRAALNDSFDNILRRIYIADGNKYDRKYIYTPGENKPVYLGTFYIYPSTDYSESIIDFIVYVPIELKLVINEYALRSTIDFYKLTSKRYVIYYE